jgi:glycosyltransferase involved in cell wall biosynthesis
MAPVIPAVPPGIPRPLWSVMIPTYDCASYLQTTLASVLAQDPGPDEMQIEVVDDCSTRDDPASVVGKFGRGRVGFHRKPQNAGATANFNTCLERSRGHLVHILHGDDLVAPGYYAKVAAAAMSHTATALFACRARIIDEHGIEIGLSPRLNSLETSSSNATQFYCGNPITAPSVTIRRRFYEQYGGFHPAFAHVADWEMWCRAIHQGSGLTFPDILASYRSHSKNDTSSGIRTGRNLREYLLLGLHHAQSLPNFQLSELHQHVATEAYRLSHIFRRAGDFEAARANYAVFQEACPGVAGSLLRLKWFASRNCDQFSGAFLRRKLGS